MSGTDLWTESEVVQMIGYLSVAIEELNSVPVSTLMDAMDKFKAAQGMAA